MTNRKQILKSLLSALGIGVLSLAPNGAAYALVCTSVASTNWSLISTWTSAGNCNRVPTTADTVVIVSGHTVTVNANASVISATVNAGGTLTQSSSLTTSGAFGVAGTVNSSSTLTIGGATSVTGVLNLTSNNARAFDGAVTLAGGTWNNSGNASITLRNGFTFNGGAFNAGTNTYTMATNSQTIGGSSPISMVDLTVTGVTLTNTGTLTVTGMLGGNGGFTNAATGTLTIADRISVNTLTASASGNTVVYSGANQTLALPATTYGNLTLSGSGAKTFPNTAMTINGNLILSGTVTANIRGNLVVNGSLTIGAGTTFPAGSYTHTIKGNFSNSGTFTPGGSTFNFNGTTPQTLAGPVSFFNLTLANASGVTASGVITIEGDFTNSAGFTAGTSTVILGGSTDTSLSGATVFNHLSIDKTKSLTFNSTVTVGGTLTLTNGNITNGVNALVIASTGSVARTSGHVVGILSKHLAIGSYVTRSFEIGGPTNYVPVTVTVDNVTAAGHMTATTTKPDHPQIAGAAIDSTKSVNRYWTLGKDGNLAFDNLVAVFNFVSGDVDGGSDTSQFIVQRYVAAGWLRTTLIAPLPTSTEAGNIVALGDFAIGESLLTDFAHEKEYVFTRELY